MGNKARQNALQHVFSVINKEQEIAKDLKDHTTEFMRQVSEIPEIEINEVVGDGIIFGYSLSGLSITLEQDYVLRLKATEGVGKAIISYFLMNDPQMQALLYRKDTMYERYELKALSVSVTPLYNASSSVAYSDSIEESLNNINQIRVPLNQARSVFDRAVAHYVRIKMKPHIEHSETPQA